LNYCATTFKVTFVVWLIDPDFAVIVSGYEPKGVPLA
jgi:hypothetical protein